MKTLTDKQKDILALIRRFRQAKGYSPTMTDIAQAMDTRRENVYQHCTRMKKKGVITWEDGLHGTLRLTNE